MQKLVFVIHFLPLCSIGHMVQPEDSMNAPLFAEVDQRNSVPLANTLATLLLAMTPTGLQAPGSALIGDRIVGAHSRHGYQLMADKPDDLTTRTEITEPWYTKAGQEQFKQVAREEAAKNKAAGKVTGRFNRFRNFLISPFPAYFQRGFKETWREDGQEAKVAKKRPVETSEVPELREPWPMFKVFFKEEYDTDQDDLPWVGSLGNQMKKDDPRAPQPGAEAPAYWKIAVPFYKPFFAFSQDKKPTKPYDPNADPIPPLWSKAGVEYVKKNGYKDVVRDFFRNNERANAPVREKVESRIDPKWGVYTEDKLKDSGILKTLERLQKANEKK